MSGFSYSSLEDDNSSSTTDPEHSALNRPDDDALMDTPLARGGRSFSEHEIADESVPQKVYLDSFGDKKRPRQKDNHPVRSPPAKNPDLKKSMRRRRSSNMEVDEAVPGAAGYTPNLATGASIPFAAQSSSGFSFPSQSSSSSRAHVPDLLSSKKPSPSKNYDPKLRPGVTPSSLSPTGLTISPTRTADPGWHQPRSPGVPYNHNLRPGVTDLSDKYASAAAYSQPLSPNRLQSEPQSSLFASNYDPNPPVHGSSPRRKMIQRQVSDDGVEGDREDECPDDGACTSPNRGQKKILKMKKTLDDKLYYRSTIDPIYIETCESYRIIDNNPYVDIVSLLKDKTRDLLQFKTECETRAELMHLMTHPYNWLDGVAEPKALKSLNLVQSLISKFILSPVKSSLPSLMRGNVDAHTGAIPKYQPILYNDSPFNTCDEEEQRKQEKARRQSPKKKAEAMGLPKVSPEDMKNLERVADRLLQECSESRGGPSSLGASGSGPLSF